MSEKHTSKLAAKVAAHNLTNAKINLLFPLYQAALTPFVGQKVVLKGGGLVSKLAKAFDAIREDNKDAATHFWTNVYNYSINIGIRGNAYYEFPCKHSYDGKASGHMSAENGFTLGDLKDGVLIKLSDFEPRKTNYSAQEVFEKRQAYAAAKQIADDAKSALFPFEEYDR